MKLLGRSSRPSLEAAGSIMSVVIAFRSHDLIPHTSGLTLLPFELHGDARRTFAQPFFDWLCEGLETIGLPARGACHSQKAGDSRHPCQDQGGQFCCQCLWFFSQCLLIFIKFRQQTPQKRYLLQLSAVRQPGRLSTRVSRISLMSKNKSLQVEARYSLMQVNGKLPKQIDLS